MSDLAPDDRPRAALWWDRRLWLMAGFGFMAGLPLPLSGFTLRQWLAEGGAPLAVIGLTANIALAYSLKFLWAPSLDHCLPPGPLRRLGQRRGWLAAIQPALALAAAILAISQPAVSPGPALAAAALVAFLSASQDIVIDAWRIEVFPQRLQGMALAVYVWGYRVALLIATTGVLAAVGWIGWHAALLALAALIGAGVVLTLLAPEPAMVAGGGNAPGPVSLLGRLRHAVLEPLLDIVVRPGAWTVLAFVALFKLGEAMAGIMTVPFYRSLGFDRPTIAGIGPLSLGGTMAGIMLGGWLVARIGVGRALLWTGWTQTVAMGMYLVLAFSPGDQTILYATVVAEAFAQGMADAAFLTYLSGLCSLAFTATHYALLSSLASIAIHTLGGFSGVLAEQVGWKEFYALCMLAALPSMVLMLRLLRRFPPDRHLPRSNASSREFDRSATPGDRRPD
ncbi:MAG: MFS transporter [Acetobacteraceae bacterium]|nr:MFS transporter [Acetobacteraceae bacterium]MSP29097.1 MFS transporter [Acetobacteraceae bacterium]